ncbi:MAG TPA: hypothetical protein VMT67_04750 [Terriglobales bacterium]|nr:hypothetical protein [Terriglobales bacterium]
MRILSQAAKYLVITAVVLYALDFGIFQVRRIRGMGMATVSVDQFLSTNLKGNKAEYDYLGTSSQPCARALFPQYAASTWNQPCWYLQRHNTTWQ